MRTKFLIVFIATISLIASLFLPFLFRSSSETFNSTLAISASLISAIFSVLTFIIAIILFNKYGIDDILMQKRTDVVFQLLEKVNGLTYIIHHKTFFLTVNLGSAEKKNLEEFYSAKLAFSNHYFSDIHSLFEIANSPFTPKSIVAKMEPIRFPMISYDIPTEKSDDYTHIYLSGQKSDETQFGRLNEKDITLFEFMIPYFEIKESIVSWIQNNTSIPISDLNT